ncbi:hypothetical protein [Pedobacter sp. UBA5917]|jgi:hypothetical protein|uniref:hypothetical protein n=1 Tax=Pedobacter sp. UBA5917 TaxID=1947061 RepID=UPI0025CFDC80|nr:hypothetical protein [Pedobacter sp. UBA5917]
MNFFPSQSFVLHSDISAKEAYDNLSKAIAINQKFFSVFSPKSSEAEQFKGYIYRSKFTIQRNLSYRNSFQAEISGEIFAEGNGCKIDIELSLMPFVKVFLTVWCSIAAFAFLGILFGAITALNPNFALAALVPLGMLGFCYLITSLGFKSDCEECRKALNAVFKVEAQPVFKGKDWRGR